MSSGSDNEDRSQSKKKENDWGWGSVLGGIAAAGALAVGAGMAYKSYKDHLEKEENQRKFSHQEYYDHYVSDDVASYPALPRCQGAQITEIDSDDGIEMNKVQVLERIHKDFVSIKERKEQFVNYFHNVRNYLIPKMKKHSLALQMLTQDEAMSGKIFFPLL